MNTKFLTLTLGLATLVSIGCDSTSNTNVNLKNVSMANNTATVVNNNSNMVNTNMNSNRMTSSNVNRADYDKNRAEYEKNKGESKIGTGASDSWIWFKTKGALALLADDLRDSTINVDVDNGVITLRGTVANAAQKAKAAEVANGIEGKTSVKNELKIAANDSMTNQVVNGNTNMKSNANMNKK